MHRATASVYQYAVRYPLFAQKSVGAQLCLKAHVRSWRKADLGEKRVKGQARKHSAVAVQWWSGVFDPVTDVEISAERIRPKAVHVDLSVPTKSGLMWPRSEVGLCL